MDIDSPTTPSMAITPVFHTDNNEGPISEEQPNKRRRKKSIVWEHFTIETVGAGCMRACCKQCKKSFAYITGSKLAGTSHLKRHIALGICPVSRQRNEALQQSTPGAKSDPPKRRYRTTPVFGGIPFDQDRCNQDVAKMIIQHEYPLHIVEHPAFINFVRTLQPQYNMVSFDTIQGECVALYLREKQNLLNIINGIPGRVSFTLDFGASNFNIGYAFLTGHFIDEDWNLHRRLLNVVMLPFPDSDYAYNQAVVSCLSDWHLENRLFTLTLDQSFSSETMTGNLRGLLSTRNPHKFNGQLLRGNCYARVLSRLAQEALGAMGDVIKRIRESVKYVKTSETHDEKFAELRQRLQVPSNKELIIDDQTKWNTTYQMLLAACELREVFACLDTSDPVYKINPSMDDWKQVEVLCTYLKLLYDAASILASPTCPPANAFYHEVSKLQLELTHAAMSQDPFVSNLNRPLKEKFDQYWKECFLILAIAVVMDPRFKMKLVEFSFSRIFGEDAGMWVKIVDDGIHELFLEYLAPNLFVPTNYMEAEHANISHSEMFQEMPLQVEHPGHVASQEASNQGADSKELQSKEEIPQMHPKEEPPQDASSQVLPHSIVQQEMHNQEGMVTHEVPVQEIHSHLVPDQQMQTEVLQLQEMHSQEVPERGVDNQEVSLQEIDIQDVTPQEMQTQEDCSMQIQTQEVPTEEIHVKEEPSRQLNTPEVRTGEVLTQEVQVDEVHPQEVPTKEVHAQEGLMQDLQHQEGQSEGIVPQETQTEGVGPQEAQTEGVVPQEAAKDMLPQEGQTEDMQLQEGQTEDMLPQEGQTEAFHLREGQTEETHEEQTEGTQEGQTEELQPKEDQNVAMHSQEGKTEKSREGQMDDMYPQEEQTEELHPKESQNEGMHTQEGQTEDTQERRTDDMHIQEGQTDETQERHTDDMHLQEEGRTEETQERQTAEMHLQEGQTEETQERQTADMHLQEGQTEETPERQTADMHPQEGQTEETRERQTDDKHPQEGQTEETQERQTDGMHPQEEQTEQAQKGQADEMHPLERQTEDMQTEEVHPLERQTEDMQTEVMHAQEAQTEEMNPREGQSEDMQTEEMNPQEGQTKEMHPQEEQAEEMQPQHGKNDEMHLQEGQPEEVHPQEEQNKEMHPQEGQTEEMNPQEEQSEKMHPQEQVEEVQMYPCGQTQDMQPAEQQTQEMCPSEAHNQMMHLPEAENQLVTEAENQVMHPLQLQNPEIHSQEAVTIKMESQDKHLQELQIHETNHQEIPSDKLHSRGEQFHDTHCQEIPGQEMQSQEIETQEMHSQELQAQEMHSQELQAQEMHAQELQAQEMHAQELQTQEMHSQELQAQEMHAQELQTQEMHPQEFQTQEMHYQSFSEEIQAHEAHTQDLPLLTIGDGFSDFEMYISEITSSQHLKSELDQYLEESLLPRVQEFDVLGWWKLNKLKYPILSKMAADILSIPVSTVAPDSVFDTRIKKIDNYRSSLRPVTLEALVCAKDWLQYGSPGSSLETSNALVKMEF